MLKLTLYSFLAITIFLKDVNGLFNKRDSSGNPNNVLNITQHSEMI